MIAAISEGVDWLESKPMETPTTKEDALETIYLVTSTNNNYARPWAVMMNSLLMNKVSANPVQIYVLHGGISGINMRKMKESIKKFNVPLHFIRMNDTWLKGIDTKRFRHGKEAFYRIFIPNIVEKKIEKVLYLDCDLIVLKDITELWNTDVKNHYLAAVQNPRLPMIEKPLGISSNDYFNSGVLLINVKKWRENHISQKVIRFIRNNPKKIQFADQDGLNKVLHDKWLRLDKKWNYPAFHLKEKSSPAIIHYITGKKPWNGNPKGKKFYFDYLKKTKW